MRLQDRASSQLDSRASARETEPIGDPGRCLLHRRNYGAHEPRLEFTELAVRKGRLALQSMWEAVGRSLLQGSPGLVWKALHELDQAQPVYQGYFPLFWLWVLITWTKGLHKLLIEWLWTIAEPGWHKRVETDRLLASQFSLRMLLISVLSYPALWEL